MPFYAAGPCSGPNGCATIPRHLLSLGPLAESELSARLAQGPIFVSASVYEPFGLVALEAAQAGCALILSDIPTFRELWEGSALFAPPRDAEAFAEAIARLAADHNLRAALGAAARRRAAEYTAYAMTLRMIEIYGDLLRSRRGAAA